METVEDLGLTLREHAKIQLLEKKHVTTSKFFIKTESLRKHKSIKLENFLENVLILT